MLKTITSALTSARLWATLRVSLFLHFFVEGAREVGHKALSALRLVVSKSYAVYLLAVAVVFPLSVTMYLLDALLGVWRDVKWFARECPLSRSGWRKAVAEAQ